MAFSDEYDFRKQRGGQGTKPTAQSFLQSNNTQNSKPTAQDFLQTKLYDQMKDQGNFERTQSTYAPKPAESPKNTSNMIDSQIYQQFNEQSFDDSKNKLNTIERGRQASAAADENVNATNMFKGLRQSVVDQADYYGAQATQRSAALFGDTWNVQNPPNWTSPGNPS